MPWRRRRGPACPPRARMARRAPEQRAPAQQKQDGSATAWTSSLKSSSLNLCRGRVVRALVVDPADLDLVALVCALEGEFDIGVLGDGRAPIGEEHLLAVVLERQLLDE